jgi:hypothetical protein
VRWDSDNAEAMTALEALEQSDGWDNHWEEVLEDATCAAVGGLPG